MSEFDGRKNIRENARPGPETSESQRFAYINNVQPQQQKKSPPPPKKIFEFLNRHVIGQGDCDLLNEF